MSKDINEESAVHLSEELQTNRKFLRSVFDRLPGMIYVHDLVNDVNLYRSWTFKRILGLKDSVEMNSGRAIRSLAHPDDIKELRRAKDEIQKAKDDECVRFSYRLKHADDNWVWLRSEEYVYERNKEGIPVKTLGYVTDISHEVEGRARLEGANRLNELMLDCAQLLSSSNGEPKTALAQLVKKISLYFGAVCDISLVNHETGIIEPLAVYHQEPVVRQQVEKIFSQNVLRKGEGMVGSVIETGREIVHTAIPKSMVEGRSAHPKVTPVSVVYMPISGSESTMGSLNLTRVIGSAEFTDDEVDQIRRIGQYISVFVQNSILTASQRAEMEKRIEVEEKLEVEKRWAEYKLEMTSLLADTDLTMTEALREMCSSISTFFDAIVDVQLVDQEVGTVSLVAIAHRNRKIVKRIEAALSMNSIKVGKGLVGSVLESGVELYFEQFPTELKEAALKNGFPKEILPYSLAYIPLQAGGETIGTIDFTRLQGASAITLFELGQMRDMAFYVSRFVENRLLQHRQQQEIQLRHKAEKYLENETRKLAELEKAHREILDAIPIQVARISQDLKYTFVNAALRGEQQVNSDLIGTELEAVLGSDVMSELMPYFKQALAGEAVTFEFSGKLANQEEHFVSTALAPHRVDGEVVGFYACSIDLTDKIAAEQEAELTKERFESLALNSGDAFFFHDEQQNILDVNEVATEMLGFTRAELLEMKAGDIDPKWKRGIYKRFLADLDLNLPQTFETVVLAKNGKEIPVESRFVKRVEGGKAYIQSLLRDRTEKRNQEMELLRSEERLRLIFENVEDFIAVLNEDGTIESVNKTTQGVMPEDVIGGSVFDWYPDKDIKNYVVPNFEKLVQTGEGFEVETTSFTGPDGSVRTYNNKYIGKFRDGEDFKVLLIIRDITAERTRELSVMNAVIEGQEQERTRVGAELHDGIGQVLTALALELSRTKQQTEQLELNDVTVSLSNIGENLQSAINEVRSISHDLMPDVLENFGLSDAIRQMCSALQDQSGLIVSFESVDVETQYAKEVEKNLYRITQELLTNAQKHAACNRIFVTLMDHGDVLNLSVEDDGVGFDVTVNGSGIGLQNVRSRVNLISGKVDIESSASTGTLVNIEVPKTLFK